MPRTLTAPSELGPSRLVLPPAFTALAEADPERVAARARDEAAAGPGRLVWACGGGVCAVAVTLAPEEPLGPARRAIYPGMAALARAVAALAAPERSVAIVWPDALLYDGALLAGATLLAPNGAAEGARPDWLVLAAQIRLDRDGVAEPGRFPNSTSLREEGLGPPEALIEAFAAYLMLGFDAWEAQGFEAAARPYLERLRGGGIGLAENGDALVAGRRQPLAGALAAAAWRDPATGGLRL